MAPEDRDWWCRVGSGSDQVCENGGGTGAVEVDIDEECTSTEADVGGINGG